MYLRRSSETLDTAFLVSGRPTGSYLSIGDKLLIQPTGNASFFQRSDDMQKLLCRREFGEEFFLFLELARVHTSSAAPQFDRVLQVQHLVVENVFDGVARYARVIEDAADDDSVMSRVVVAETAPGVVLAPGELRTTHESVEEATVEVFEDFF